MKKNIYIFFLALLSGIILTNGNNIFTPNLAFLRLKGNVKILKETHYVNNTKSESIRYILTFFFNKKGLVLEDDYKVPGQTRFTKSIRNYDERGNYISSDFYHSDSLFNKRSVYKYDSKNNRIEEYSYNSKNELQNKRTYIYDNHGNIIEDHYLTTSDNSIHKIVYQFDNNNNIIVESEFIMDSLVSAKNKKYDVNNNLIEANYIFSDEQLNYKTINEYDSLRNIRKSFNFNPTGTLDEESVLKKGAIFDEFEIYKKLNGKLYLDSYYKTTKDDYTIEEKHFDSDGKLQMYLETKFEYDKNGNWIKKIEYEDGEVINITEREITYY